MSILILLAFTLCPDCVITIVWALSPTQTCILVAIIFLRFWHTLYGNGSLIKGRINTSETHFVVFFIFPTNIQNSRYKKYISHEYSYKPLLRPTYFQLSFQFLLVHSSINFSQSSSNVTQCLRPLVMFFSSLSYEEILYHT